MKKYVEKKQMPDGWYMEYKDLPIHEKIRRCREARGISQDDLADRVSISRFGLSKIETNRSEPTLESRTNLEEVLGLPAGFLVSDYLPEEKVVKDHRDIMWRTFLNQADELGVSDEDIEDMLEAFLFTQRRKAVRR